jgi:hypothetical protein
MTTDSSVGHATAELSTTFSGKVLRPGDAEYEDARKVHNGLIDKRPALAVRDAGSTAGSLAQQGEAERLREAGVLTTTFQKAE